MKKKLIALGALFAICLSLLATDMVVKQKNGEIKSKNRIITENQPLIYQTSNSTQSSLNDGKTTYTTNAKAGDVYVMFALNEDLEYIETETTFTKDSRGMILYALSFLASSGPRNWCPFSFLYMCF